MKCVESLRYNIKSKGIKLDEKDKQYIEEKIITGVGKYFDDSSTIVDVSVRDTNGPKGGVDKEINIVITLKDDKNPIKITEQDVHVNEAIDKAADRVEKVLRRMKKKFVKSGRYPRKYYINKKLQEEG